MEDKELVQEKLGEVGTVELAIKDDKLVLDLEVGYSKGPISASNSSKIALDAVAVAVVALQYLKEKIPGHFDDAVIDGAIALLQKKS